MIIVQDTREQKPYWKEKKGIVETKKLNTGDYSIKGFENKFVIERKSCGDLFGTLGKGHKRFKRELERAANMDYFGIYIEGTEEQIKNKDFLGSYHTKMRGFVILKILKTIELHYGVDVVFCKNRVGCKKAIKNKFSSLLSNYKHLNKTEKRMIHERV